STVATNVEDVEAMADDVVADDVATLPAPEPLETDAVPRVASAAIHQVESVVETAVGEAILESAPSPPPATTEPVAPVASREPVPSHEGSRPAPRVPTALL